MKKKPVIIYSSENGILKDWRKYFHDTSESDARFKAYGLGTEAVGNSRAINYNKYSKKFKSQRRKSDVTQSKRGKKSSGIRR